MAQTNSYLNYMGQTEEAFNFYRVVFGTEVAMPIQRMSDVPPGPGVPQLRDAEKKMVMGVEFPIVGAHILMGMGALESMGHKLVLGTNVSINLEPDTCEETMRLLLALADGGKVTMDLQDMFWGAYCGAATDRYGVEWMVNRAAKP
jgi:PhnB protein